MPLAEFLHDLDELAVQGAAALGGAIDQAGLEAARVEFLGAKSGRLKAAQKGLGGVAGADKPAAGKRFNEVKQLLEAALAEAQSRLANADATPSGPALDPTQPGPRPILGHLHPLTQTIEELKEIMGRLGFTVADGPEIEDEWHNFEALNIPADHPARDPLENFFLSTAAVGAPANAAGTRPIGSPGAGKPLLLRSQTSTVQIRVMEQQPPPVRIIAARTSLSARHGRRDALSDVSSDRRPANRPECHDGRLEEHVAIVRHKLFGSRRAYPLPPVVFPFTEPSVEVDMSWGERWIEMGGAGMVDPNVLRAVGYDPEQVTGFAFGLGVERVCARRHGVTDIREFYKNDVQLFASILNRGRLAKPQSELRSSV